MASITLLESGEVVEANYFIPFYEEVIYQVTAYEARSSSH